MRVLTDCRERVSDIAPGTPAWIPHDASVLDEPERGLWRLFAESPTVWATTFASKTSATFWHRLIIIGEAARSQFDALHEALGQGLLLDGPTAVMALDGRDFHGQRGRPWSVIEGNLFLTIGLPVGAPATVWTPGLIMLPVVTLVDAIRDGNGAGPRPTIKWVNDILMNGRKVAGVLTASLCRNGLLEAAVLGLGVNVARAPNLEPTPFVPAAGCLIEEGVDVTLAQFLWRLLERLAEWYLALRAEGPVGLLDAYRRASCVVGQPVRVWDESSDGLGVLNTDLSPFATGVVRSIEPDLSLRIDGYKAPVTRGRVALEEACVALGL